MKGILIATLSVVHAYSAAVPDSGINTDKRKPISDYALDQFDLNASVVVVDTADFLGVTVISLVVAAGFLGVAALCGWALYRR